jgi:hypothetical protein
MDIFGNDVEGLSSRMTLIWAVGLLGDTNVTIQPMSIPTFKPRKSTSNGHRERDSIPAEREITLTLP